MRKREREEKGDKRVIEGGGGGMERVMHVFTYTCMCVVHIELVKYCFERNIIFLGIIITVYEMY